MDIFTLLDVVLTIKQMAAPVAASVDVEALNDAFWLAFHTTGELK